MWRQGPHAQSVFQRISITRRFSAELVKLLVSVWSASGTYPHDAPVDNRPRPQPHGLRPIDKSSVVVSHVEREAGACGVEAVLALDGQCQFGLVAG